MLSKEPSVNLISNLEADFRSQNAEALQKIAIFADLSEGFTIGFVEVNLERDRNFAIAALEARNDTDLQWISLQFSDPDLRYLIAAITEALQRVELIPEKKIILLISGLERTIGGYGDYPPLLSNLNVARDTYTHKLPYPMLFFLPSYAMTRFARFAPDFWAWKSIEVRLQSDLSIPDPMADLLIEQLCLRLAEKLQAEPTAGMNDLITYMKNVIEADTFLKSALTEKAVQINQGNARGYQVLVEGGIAYIGQHLHVSDREVAEMPHIPADQKIIPVSQERFDLSVSQRPYHSAHRGIFSVAILVST